MEKLSFYCFVLWEFNKLLIFENHIYCFVLWEFNKLLIFENHIVIRSSNIMIYEKVKSFYFAWW